MDESSSRLISETLWKEVAAVPREGLPTEAAISYYAKDLLCLKKGDTLVCDASVSTISSGASSGPLLLALHKKGVKVYSQAALHAKVACIGRSVLVGSANSSSNSENTLVEAAVLSQDRGLYAQVFSFVNQLAQPVALLNSDQLTELANIPVLQDQRPLKPSKPVVNVEGLSQAWWLSTGPRTEKLTNELAPQEKKGLRVAKKLAPDFDSSELEPISWPIRFPVAKNTKPGDRVIQAHASKKGDGSTCMVYAPAVIVHVEQGPTHVIIYLKSLHPEVDPLALDYVEKVTKTFARKLTVKSARKLNDEEFSKIEDLF
jgi:hypothetical protein